MTNSQIPASMEELRPNADSKGDLGIHARPELGTTEARSSSLKQAKPGREVEKLGQLASIPNIHPEPAHTETVVPTLITSKLQNAEVETVERQGVLGHAKRIKNIPETKSLVRPIPKALEGYIIQVSFDDRSEARRWADSFEQRGYAVSMTEAGSAESLRVRVGNFRLRDDAERQLKNIRENGLVGIILNLPQAYRPEVRSSLP
jgi:cell division septation protein DedD